ncbi:MAG: GNAT family N-acetyltransferase [Marivibrio sp.]|uniref:GNAT family N-acetyltransferase n=1 Tax=Marivibrio sp. TaxID=2039719 RepID=UPI0032EEDB79
MIDIEIRRARRNEACEAAELVRVALGEGAERLWAQDAAANESGLQAAARTMARADAPLPLSAVHLATLDAMPAGLLLSRPEAASRGWRIVALAVYPEYRGMGLGRRLMRLSETLARAHEATRLELKLPTDAAAARGFFEAQGFRAIGTPSGGRLSKPLGESWAVAA